MIQPLPGRRPATAVRGDETADLLAPGASSAVGGYVLGRLSLGEASVLAGLPEEAVVELVAERATGAGVQGLAGAEAAPLFSVVIPVLDEEENLAALHRELTRVMVPLGTYETIFVDDGSDDASVAIILELAQHDPSVKLVRLSRNFGHQAALSAGLDHATGQAVVFMDADLQDPPQLLEELVQRWRAGGEVVYAYRTKRQAPRFKRLGYFVFYRLFQRLAEMDVPLDSGDFCLIDRRVADAIRGLPERNRFLRGLRSWVGFRQVGVPYQRPDRLAGEVKYTTRRLVKLALDGLLSFSSFPLRVASYLGFFTSALGVLYTLFAVMAQLLVGELPAGWTSTIAILLTVSGVQLIMTGVLGEYLARTYEEAKGRPTYVVRDTHGLGRRT